MIQINKRPAAFREASAGKGVRFETMNTEQLRSTIDHGGTGDKINWPDPAATPRRRGRRNPGRTARRRNGPSV